MNRIKIFGYLSVLVLTVSCNHVYREYDKDSFSTYSWDDGQEVAFNPTIADPSKMYQLILGLRHHFALNMVSFDVEMKIIAPSGKETSQSYTLRIKDSTNKNIGRCAGDICDLEAVVLDNLKFEETGEYKVLVSHNKRGYKIPGVLEVGVIIDEKD